jgi:hypothetical protein
VDEIDIETQGMDVVIEGNHLDYETPWPGSRTTTRRARFGRRRRGC